MDTGNQYDSVMESPEDSVESLECLEDLGPECMQDMPWANEFLEKIIAHVRKGFYNWCKIVKPVAGTEEDRVKLWQKSFLDQIDETLGIMVVDMCRFSNETCKKIDQLLEKLATVCKEIGKPFPQNIGENSRCFLDEKYDLEQQIKECEVIIDARKADLKKLQDKQDKYCKELGEIPTFKITYPPLPTTEQLEEFHKHLETLEALKFEREEQYYNLKEEILKYISEIDYEPHTNFEKMVVQSDQFQGTTENMEKLELFAKEIKQTRESTIEEIQQLRTQVEELWKLLDVDLKEQDEFRTCYSKNSISTLEVLRGEVKRCQEIKKINIKEFVGKLRTKLSELWKQCHCTEQDKRSFKYFEDDCYTEDLLDLHELEIEKWQSFYRHNNELLTAIDRHEELWRKVQSLDNSAASSNRYQNRGGKLLKEEKERNKLQKLIPKTEERITELANLYLEEKDNGPFRFCSNLLPSVYCGRTVKEYLEELYEDREMKRKEKLSARKQQRGNDEKTPVQKTPVGLFASTSKVTPAYSAKRKILGTPLTENSKRPRGETPKRTPGVTPRVIPKITVTKVTTLVGQKRRSLKSIEKTKRRHSGRLVAAGSKSKKQLDDRDDDRETTYSFFENDLSNKDDCTNSTYIQTLKTTPKKTALPKTPVRTPRLLRTPNRTPRTGDQTKMSVCKSSTKLLF